MPSATLDSETLGIFLAGVATIAIYSFLIKENFFYRAFEHLYIGIAAGFVPVFTLKNFLWPQILEPIFGINTSVFPDGTVEIPYQPLYLIYLVPMAFGLLYYTVFFPKISWLSKLVIGFSIGAAATQAIRGFFPQMIPQIVTSFKPLIVFSADRFDYIASFSNIIFIATLLMVLKMFFFTFKGQNRLINTDKFARYMLMICFGAFLGSTIMARMALLVERIQFLSSDWVRSLKEMSGMIINIMF